MKLYNSLSQKIEPFIPLDNNNVKMYVCGITPYDTTHLGHAFTFVFFDVLHRYLEYKKYNVNFVENVTDIDDDILKRARETGKEWKELGIFWTQKFLEDMASLNVLPSTHFVKATNSIDSMIQITKVLIKKGSAYEKGGNIYFAIDKFKDYGKLSRLNKKQMLILAKERGLDINDPFKKNELDFILWQKSKNDEPYWNSPWGKGRPGWHIECSAMINQYLGGQIDIHGGGRDLIFPHHDSEIAQSEQYSGKQFVKYWLHTGMVMYQGEKMAKSLGNLIMISDLLKKYSPNAIRFLLLSHKYRLPWEYLEEDLEKCETEWNLISSALKIEPEKNAESFTDLTKFEETMNHDMDTPNTLVKLKTMAHEILKNNETNLQSTLRTCLLILGFSF